MKQASHRMSVRTHGKGLYEITGRIVEWLASQGIREGVLTVFVQHTSASLVIQENADPDVVRDLKEFFARVAPDGASWYEHTIEGPDDMSAHIRAALTATSLSIPVVGGRLGLGTWQGVYLFEHRAVPHTRTVVLHVIGE
ncbi:MAG: secondary thiamine-phosphate synthase enzyme YjbQ [Bryobacterales bacterium]|nr:secondary thiamine-phosphate synthase enzyme YjbQ [Bryobacteraceae bacterium]MDW8131490.1 secondary thiamine-phosphate synthase enzyme YjbQ [Bryobacterales bacterium]